MPMLLTVFLRTLLVLPFKCCYSNIIVPCGHSRQPPSSGDSETTSLFGIWKRLPETNAGKWPEVTATAGGCGECWKLWRVAGKACNMTENLSILIIFLNNSNKPRPQTETCVFSDVEV